MSRRPVRRSAPSRRSWLGPATLLVVLSTAVLLASACESEPNAASAPPASGLVPTPTSTVVPASGDDPAVAPTEPGEPVPTSIPTTSSTLPDRSAIVTGGTTVSHPGGGSPTAATIRTVDFGELTYPTSVCAAIIDQPPAGGFQLVDGEVHAGEDETDGPYSVTLQPPRTFGDVNHDGHDDTALVLECSRGGQPVPTGWIYTLDDSGPRPLAGVTLDPDSLPTTGVLDTSLTELRINGTSVITDWDVYLDGDALCCPTMTATVVWSWTDGRLTAAAPTLIRANARG